MKIELESTFTPWTLDTYSTFNMEDAEYMLLENWNEDTGKDLSYDELDWKYDMKGYLNALAENWLKLVNENILDNVIKKVTADGEPTSPKEYNFTTDTLWSTFEVDIDALKKYISEHQASYDANKLKSCDGFWYMGDETQNMLYFYLKTASVELLNENDYYMQQMEDVQPYEYISSDWICSECEDGHMVETVSDDTRSNGGRIWVCDNCNYTITN